MNITLFAEWLEENDMSTDFEQLPTDDLNLKLCKFYAEIVQQNGKPYSKSVMINAHSGLNQHLTLPPYNRSINLMQDQAFLTANKVFKGRLRQIKQDGHDVKHTYRDVLSTTEMAKIYDNYFMPNIGHNPRALQHKVYLDITYHMACRGKQNLCKLFQNQQNSTRPRVC